MTQQAPNPGRDPPRPPDPIPGQVPNPGRDPTPDRPSDPIPNQPIDPTIPPIRDPDSGGRGNGRQDDPVDPWEARPQDRSDARRHGATT